MNARPRAVELDAPAKVNLVLRVLDRRPSGYHDIETLFQAVGLCDRLRVEAAPAGELGLRVEGGDAGPAEDNLVVRAARAYLRAARPGWGVRIRLTKRIPAGAGLGGGSSDAAATLRALDRLADGALPPERLRALAAELGADVPFFLGSSPLAVGRGRGDRLTPMPPLAEAGLVLGLPDVHVSTAEAYAALARVRGRDGTAGGGPPLPPDPLRDWDAIVRAARNDFERVVPAAHPGVERALRALRAGEAAMVMLSGSGGAVFSLHDDLGAARRAAAAAALRDPDTRFVAVRSLTRWPEPIEG